MPPRIAILPHVSQALQHPEEKHDSLPMRIGQLVVFRRYLCQDLLCHLQEVSSAPGMLGKDGCAPRHNSEQDSHDFTLSGNKNRRIWLVIWQTTFTTSTATFTTSSQPSAQQEGAWSVLQQDIVSRKPLSFPLLHSVHNTTNATMTSRRVFMKPHQTTAVTDARFSTSISLFSASERLLTLPK